MANKFSNWVKSLFAAGALATGTSVMGAEAQENPEEVNKTDKIENIQQSEKQKTDAPEIIKNVEQVQSKAISKNNPQYKLVQQPKQLEGFQTALVQQYGMNR